MRRRLTVCVLVFVFAALPCTAILNTGTANYNRPTSSTSSICDTRLCNCKANKIVCNCGSTTLGEELAFEGIYKLHDTEEVVVENCRQLRIPGTSFKHLDSLRKVRLVNISRIIIESRGFSWKLNESSILEANPSYLDNVGSILIAIENSTVPYIPSFAFQGRIEAIYFLKVQVGTVSPFAFSNLFRTETIEFTNTNFTNLEAQAFKKFLIHRIRFFGGHYGSLPSRTMVDLEVTNELLIEDVQFDHVFSSALIIKGPTLFSIYNCRFSRLDGDAFRVVTNGPVHIRKNVFEYIGAGAFVGVTVNKEVFSPLGPQKLEFEMNNLTQFVNGSLVFNTSRLAPKLGRLYIEQPCSCASTTLWADQLIVYPPSSAMRKKLLADGKHRDSTLMMCRYDEKGRVRPQYINFQDYNRVNCGAVSSGVHALIVASAVVGLVVLLAVGVGLGVYVCRRRRARWINVSTTCKYEDSPKMGTERDRSPDSRITMVVPDGRVYRETEFHVIVEQAQPITNTREEHTYQNLKPIPLPRTIKQPVPSLRTDL